MNRSMSWALISSCHYNMNRSVHKLKIFYPHWCNNTYDVHKKEFITAGQDLKTASRVLIMIHGRGASADDILSLSDHLEINDFALLAPRATNHAWYPYSFLVVPAQNEPWLS